MLCGMSTSRRAIRAIFFDAGNTLLRMNYGDIAAALSRLGVALTVDAIQRAEWRARVRLDTDVLGAAAASTESLSTADRYLRFVLAELGIADEGTVAAGTAWRRAYNVPGGLFNVVEPCAEAALRAARDAGLTAAVISNSNGTVRSLLAGLGLTRYLDFVVDSGEVGVEKPDPRIFRLALARASVAPSEALYVGDLYSVDVLGARAAGLDAILIDPGGCWGTRDCVSAPDVLAAVGHVVDGDAARARDDQ